MASTPYLAYQDAGFRYVHLSKQDPLGSLISLGIILTNCFQFVVIMPKCPHRDRFPLSLLHLSLCYLDGSGSKLSTFASLA